MYFFFWIHTTPFPDLSGDPSNANDSNLINQLSILILSGSYLLFALFSPMRQTILQPRILLCTLFLWYTFVSVISSYPAEALKHLVLAMLVCINAGIFLLLPATEERFAKLLGIATLIMLAVAYFGVFFLPVRAIHQASEVREPLLAGFWRGQFVHKNSAAAIMVIAVFFGLYVYSMKRRVTGGLIVVLSVIFLLHTGGKTSTAALPGILILAFIFETWKWTRIPIAVGSIALINFFTIGSAVSPAVRAFVTSLGIDASFTNRTDIWKVAFTAISQNPITGYGFQLFWGTKEIVYGGGSIETWAVAAFNGHNAYLDILLTTGIPGLLLTLTWLVFLPLKYISQATKTTNNPYLTRLFIRIWLYGVLTACVETVFFESGSPMWFSLLFAVFGLRLQANASLESEQQARVAA
ncbi:O-antigen ligase family protein [Phyllobacterium sp. 628]|nr:O-antigen ligase family protein [Phyllobacterium sp. 628]